jgi:hypothetical protein
MAKTETGDDDDPPAPPVKREPPVKRDARKCPSCDTTTDGTYCPGCGAKMEGGAARPTTIGSRVADLEKFRDSLAPVARLAERLKGRGVDPDAVSDEQLDMVGGLVSGGGIGGLGDIMRLAFPGLPFGGGKADDE